MHTTIASMRLLRTARRENRRRRTVSVHHSYRQIDTWEMADGENAAAPWMPTAASARSLLLLTISVEAVRIGWGPAGLEEGICLVQLPKDEFSGTQPGGNFLTSCQPRLCVYGLAKTDKAVRTISKLVLRNVHLFTVKCGIFLCSKCTNTLRHFQV